MTLVTFSLQQLEQNKNTSTRMRERRWIAANSINSKANFEAPSSFSIHFCYFDIFIRLENFECRTFAMRKAAYIPERKIAEQFIMQFPFDIFFSLYPTSSSLIKYGMSLNMMLSWRFSSADAFIKHPFRYKFYYIWLVLLLSRYFLFIASSIAIPFTQIKN